jgi:hypothetical protein
MELEGRRRRFTTQTNRKQAKTIQAMVHTGMTINKYRFGFPLPEVIAVDMLTAGRVVKVMWGYSVETFNCVVGEEIVVIVGGQSLSIFTMVVKGHFRGLSQVYTDNFRERHQELRRVHHREVITAKIGVPHPWHCFAVWYVVQVFSRTVQLSNYWIFQTK